MTTDRNSGLSCRVQSIAVQDAKRLLLGVTVTVRDSVDDGCPSLLLTKVCGGADGGLVRKLSACFVLVKGKRGAVSLVSGDGRRRCRWSVETGDNSADSLLVREREYCPV